ncbi:hypothetical protein A0H81_10693 [Grifola frondosa]|uniref:Uncharacterized protein n=2 Tax=Grifola frondosa TaxID=5627 RepID=A0A1C7LXD2_GRIFR|nr:hypothetical protein A0H81_10693 [Grifola frondosa]
MAAGVDKDQEVAAGIDVKEAAAAAEEGEAAGMTNSILDVDAQQDSPHMYNLAAPTPVSPLTRAASLTRPAIVTSTRSCSPHACSQHPSQNRFLAEPLVSVGWLLLLLVILSVCAVQLQIMAEDFSLRDDGAVGGGELVLVPEPREQRAVGKRERAAGAPDASGRKCAAHAGNFNFYFTIPHTSPRATSRFPSSPPWRRVMEDNMNNDDKPAAGEDEAAAVAGVDEENAASVMPAGDTQDEEEPAGDTQDEDEEEGVEPAGIDEEEEAAAGDTQDDEEPAREDENEEEPAGDTQDVDEAAGIDEEEAAGVEQAGDTQDEEEPAGVDEEPVVGVAVAGVDAALDN